MDIQDGIHSVRNTTQIVSTGFIKSQLTQVNMVAVLKPGLESSFRNPSLCYTVNCFLMNRVCVLFSFTEECHILSDVCVCVCVIVFIIS